MAAITPAQSPHPKSVVPYSSPYHMGAKTSNAVNPATSVQEGQKKEEDTRSSEPERASSPAGSALTQPALTENDLKLIQELKKTDTEVRAHEMAHIAAGGQYITSGANLQYRKGPDGINYAVAGEVSIDTSPIPGDPRATALKMQKIKAAALAPSSPSAQDRKVAAAAVALAAKATAEIMALMTAQQSASAKNEATGSPSVSNGTAATAYAGMAEQSTPRGTYINASA